MYIHRAKKKNTSSWKFSLVFSSVQIWKKATVKEMTYTTCSLVFTSSFKSIMHNGLKIFMKSAWNFHTQWFHELRICLVKSSNKAYSLSKKFCTGIPFSKNDSWCQLWLGLKGLVRRIPFIKKWISCRTVYSMNRF